MKLSEIYDKLAENKNIPKEVTSAVFKIMNSKNKSEVEKREEVGNLMHAMRAGSDHTIYLLRD